ncbi:MAG: AsmA-like C-terminal domain-containing protein, partial [Rhizobium sp.]
DMIEPTEKSSAIKRQRVITATLSNQQRDALLPGLADFVDGPLKVELSRIDDDRQGVEIDLTKAALTVPWIGWSKGSGIAANAAFETSGPADQLSLKNFTLKGDGFGAAGSIQVGKSGLTSADFSSVKLASVDDFALSIKKTKGAFDVRVDGNAADIRPILARLKSPGKSAGDSNDKTDATIHAKLDKIIGFNDETINNVNLVYALNNGKATQADFSGVTRTGQAVVTEMTKGGQSGTFHVTSSDAGSLARFVDVYGHLKGGLLNLNLRAAGDDIWDGSIDIRRFSIVNEKKLQSIVTTPAGRNGQSLNAAVKHGIDTSAQNFQRGFAHLMIRKGVLSVENGVVRGEQVGATFQGTIKDSKGNTDMTGTFMPAYGLNRLFAEVPIVGFLLGNGSDRGLIGITFKLTGSFDSPNLVINPLSVIAPGIFRQIFEF